MRLASMVPFRFTAIWLAFLAMNVWAQRDGLFEQYCSSENTASNYDAVFNIYQSNGACKLQCQGEYAFAVVQYQNCWCSNWIPQDQQDTRNCNQECPGYPDDLCGNESAGLYGYIPLYRRPYGTAGGSSSTQASSTPSSSSTSESSTQQSSTQPDTSSSQAPATSYVSQTVYQTVTQRQSPSFVVSSIYVTPTTSTSTSSSDVPSSTTLTTAIPSTSSTTMVAPVSATTQSSSSSTPHSATPSPVTSIRVITVSGAVTTQTVTSTPTFTPGSAFGSEQLQRKQLSGGAIAGIVIGTMLGVAALMLGAFLLWRRRRQTGDTEGAGAVAAARGPNNSPRRNISVLSRTGLLSRGRPTSMVENTYDNDAVYGNGGNASVRHSMLFGAAAAGEGVSPVSPLGSTHDNDSTRRYSRPMVYDQRLNPSALFANAEGNGSRISMQDQQDYSRPLGIANPDVRPSFESRITS